MRFDQIDGSYDDNNKLKPKNPYNRLHMDRLSKRHAIYVKAQTKSVKTVDSGEKWLHHVNNQLFNMDRSMNLSDLTYYL